MLVVHCNNTTVSDFLLYLFNFDFNHITALFVLFVFIS